MCKHLVKDQMIPTELLQLVARNDYFETPDAVQCKLDLRMHLWERAEYKIYCILWEYKVYKT